MGNAEAENLFNKGNEAYESGNFEEAIKCYAESARLTPDNVETFINWGTALSGLAKIKNDEVLFRQSFEKYEKAAEINPQHADAFYNWGNALSKLAEIKEDEALFRQSFEKYEKAAKINPQHAGAFNNWGNALSELAKIKEDEALFRQSFEKYEKAAEINPQYADAFLNWGTALSELAEIKEDEALFRQSFEKYEKAAEINPQDADTFFNWGTVLCELAKIKNDEALFRQSFEKYEKATGLDSQDADIFYNWGSALCKLAKITNDEALFRQSFEKYEKAAEINPQDAGAFNNWGNALSDLAEITNDEALFRQSFEKYEKAAEINPQYAGAFYNWGIALYDLAKIKNDESLYKESIEKFKNATQLKPDYASAFINWGVVLYKLVKITKDKSLFKEAIQCFKNSKKDILYILVFFDDDDDLKDILEKNILYPLLDPETYDGKFFEKITQNIDKNELDNYKKAYLLSVYIISKLHINNTHENLVAHYCKKTISHKMLFDDSKFRLNAINYSNDPKEGETLLDYLYKNRASSTKEPLKTEYIAFAGCFSFNYDSLTQFRLYGKEDGWEGTGLSLVFKKSFFSKKVRMPSEQSPVTDKNVKPEEEKHALFRCIYVDPETQRVETVGQKDKYLFYRENNEDTFKDYDGYIKGIIDIIDEEMKELKNQVKGLKQDVIGQLLINLRYLTKHIAFKEEQECRIITIKNLGDEEIKTSKNFGQMYVKYKLKVSSHIDKIYFGPNAGGMKLFQDILTHKSLTIPYEQSKNPLA